MANEILEKSIKIWENRLSFVIKNKGKAVSSRDIISIGRCPLCLAYQNRDDIFDCELCPIYKHTNLKYCHNTPFYNYSTLVCYSTEITCNDQLIDAVQEEVCFLRSLRNG